MHASVLFDLDGTLVDSAPDLCFALNTVLQVHNRPQVTLEEIRPWVSKGTPAMLKLGFGISPTDSGFNHLRKQFLNAYSQNLCTKSRLFDGIAQLISLLGDADIAWGIVTNKPAAYTNPLVALLEFSYPPASIISGDTLAQKKPDPAPLLLACDELACFPHKSIYAGDDQRDIQAGIAAGMKTIAVGYGYTPPDDDPKQWGADKYVATVAELNNAISTILQI